MLRLPQSCPLRRRLFDTGEWYGRGTRAGSRYPRLRTSLGTWYSSPLHLSSTAPWQRIRSLLELGNEGRDVQVHRPADLQQLHNIQPANTPLDVADENLGSPDGLGQVRLRELGSLPRTPKVLAEKLVLSLV